jgi:hypothetical protein
MNALQAAAERMKRVGVVEEAAAAAALQQSRI